MMAETRHDTTYASALCLSMATASTGREASKAAVTTLLKKADKPLASRRANAARTLARTQAASVALVKEQSYQDDQEVSALDEICCPGFKPPGFWV
jgi:hypothetical protein